MHPALNHNSNEFTASIALSSLKRIDKTNQQRVQFCLKLLAHLEEQNLPFGNNRFDSNWAPFYLTLFKKSNEKIDIKLIAEQMNKRHGVPLLVNYGCLASRWPWLKKHLAFPQEMPVATKNIESSFNLFLNEKYRDSHSRKIVKSAQAVLKTNKF